MFLDFMNDHADELIADLAELVAVDSVRGEEAPGAPYGKGPRAALETAERIAKKYGFDAEVRGDRVLCVEYGEGEPALAILAHLDVVPVGTGWKMTEPFKAALKDGVLYGRGVADDKGPAVASLYALRALRENGIGLGKKVQLLLGSDEECGSSDIDWYLKNYKMPPMVFTPDGDFPVVNTEKGRIEAYMDAPAGDAPNGAYIVSLIGGTAVNAVPGEARATLRFVPDEQIIAAMNYCSFFDADFDIESKNGPDTTVVCRGKASHGSLPELGVNAVSALLKCILAIPLADCAGLRSLMALNDALPFGDTCGMTIGAYCEDEESGGLTVNLGMMDYSVDGGLHAGLDCRVPCCGDGDEVMRRLDDALKGCGITVTVRDQVAPHKEPADGEFVQKLLKIYEDYTGEKGETLSMGGLTYVHEVEGGVAFGCTFPGREPRMHEPDENIPLADLILAGAMYGRAAAELCK